MWNVTAMGHVHLNMGSHSYYYLYLMEGFNQGPHSLVLHGGPVSAPWPSANNGNT